MNNLNPENLLGQLNITDPLSSSVELFPTLFSFIICVLISFLVRSFYIRYGNSVAGKLNLGNIIPILSSIVFLVILVVKSSLALSLGLVGALSIVRFRTPIKEPEELVYLFLVIAAGLGCGANQLKITILGILLSLLIIYLYSLASSKKNIDYLETLNIAIIINHEISDNDINNIIDKISKISKQVKFISMSRNSDSTNINLDLKIENFKNLVTLTDKMKSEYKNSKVIIARNSDLSL